MEELASADRSKAMEKAVTKLGGRVGRAGEALCQHHRKEEAVRPPPGPSSRSWTVIGGEVTEAQRREGIRRAVEIQHTVMPELLPVLREEVGPTGIFGIAHLNQAEGEKATLMSRYNTDHKAKRLSKNPDKRLTRLRRIREAWDRTATVNALYRRLHEAVEQLIVAEQALYDTTTGAGNREQLYEAVGRVADRALAVSRIRKRLKE